MREDEFVRRVREELEEIRETTGRYNEGDLFAIWFGKEILGYEMEQVAETYHIGGRGDEKIDLGIIDDEQEMVFVVQAKYSTEPLRRQFGKNCVDEVWLALQKLEREPDIGNSRRREFARRYRQKKNIGYQVRPVLVCFGKLSPAARNYAAKKDIQVYDFERLKEEYERLKNPAEFKTPQYLRLPVTGKNYLKYRDVLVLIADVNDIYNAFKKHGPGLFEENLRYKLSNTSKWRIAEDIKTTLREAPDKFLVLNNGINIVCKEAQAKNKMLILYEPQIVNGCQTVYGIYDTIESCGGQKIKNAYVVVKIVETTDRRLQERITFAANYQYPILPRDFKSNDRWQVAIQRAFNEKFIFYERKRGEWELMGCEGKRGRFRVRGQVYRKLDNELSGQLYLALAGEPAVAKNKKSLIFNDPQYYKTLFEYENRDWSEIGISEPMLRDGLEEFVDDIIFAYGIYKFVLSIGKYTYKQKLALFEGSDSNPVYNEVRKKEFLCGYWSFYVVRLFHYIVERYVSGNDKKRYELRRRLIGDYLNSKDELSRLFEPFKKIAQYFHVDESLQRADILDPDSPSMEYPLFGKWFSSLEQIVYGVVAEAMDKDWKNYNYFFYKKRDTLEKITNKILQIIVNSQRAREYFPEEWSI